METLYMPYPINQICAFGASVMLPNTVRRVDQRKFHWSYRGIIWSSLHQLAARRFCNIGGRLDAKFAREQPKPSF